MKKYIPRNIPLFILGLMLLFISFALVQESFVTTIQKTFVMLVSVMYGVIGFIFSIYGAKNVL